MLVKLVTHVVALGVGGALGVYWGVNHPQAAGSVDAKAAEIKAAIAQGKQEALQKVVDERKADADKGAPPTSHLDEYNKMLDDAKQDYNAAKSAVSN
jgi:hypothetical protein